MEKTDKEFEEYLTEIYGEVNICGLKYNAGWALRQIDPVAFRVAKGDCEDD